MLKYVRTFLKSIKQQVSPLVLSFIFFNSMALKKKNRNHERNQKNQWIKKRQEKKMQKMNGHSYKKQKEEKY